MEGMGISCFFGAAMKRTGVSGRAKGSTGINWSALYPDNGLKSLMEDKWVRRWALNDRLSRGWPSAGEWRAVTVKKRVRP
jgi:hypothetical protein